MTHSTRYRMYVDESGDHVMDPSKWSSPDARYLGLTGVVIASDNYRTRTHPEFEALKQEFFPHDPDEPLVLVRNQIVGKRNLFQVLRDPEVAAHWEDRVIQFFQAHVSQIITVVLDKEEHLRSPRIPAPRPYSYCMTALTERYGQWLNEVDGTGDVMIESRGRGEDRGLKNDFHDFMTAQENPRGSLQSVTSTQLKLSLKTDNITGLQLADLLAFPSKKGTLLDHELVSDSLAHSATGRIIKAVRPQSNDRNGLLS